MSWPLIKTLKYLFICLDNINVLHETCKINLNRIKIYELAFIRRWSYDAMPYP